jgi:hypothetical protein
MYYVLLNELEKPKFDMHIEGALLNSKGQLTPNIFGQGASVKSIADSNYSISVDSVFSKPGKLRDRLSLSLYHSVHLLVVSQRIAKLLNEIAPDEVELYSFSFKYDDRICADYKIVNVLSKIDCVDYEQSTIEFDSYDDNYIGEGPINTIDGMVLNESLIPNKMNIFLLGRHNDSIIILNDRLKKRLEDEDFSGFVFCSPKDFQL